MTDPVPLKESEKCLAEDCQSRATVKRPASGLPVYCKRHSAELLERARNRFIQTG